MLGSVCIRERRMRQHEAARTWPDQPAGHRLLLVHHKSGGHAGITCIQDAAGRVLISALKPDGWVHLAGAAVGDHVISVGQVNVATHNQAVRLLDPQADLSGPPLRLNVYSQRRTVRLPT